jgi:hypothetical protein
MTGKQNRPARKLGGRCRFSGMETVESRASDGQDHFSSTKISAAELDYATPETARALLDVLV